jgi:ribosomal protein S27AE
MDSEKKCPKCGRELAAGFMLDADSTSNWPRIGMAVWFSQSRWVAGKPEPSSLSGIKWADKEAFNLKAWRCPDCGFVELYAVEPTKYREAP